MDLILKALSDRTRRTLMDSLREKDGQTLTELEEKLAMSRFGVMKHLKLLEEANLVISRKSGRFKHHYLNAVPLQEVIDRWIEPLIAKQTARNLIDLKSKLERTSTMLDADTTPDFVHQTFIRCTRDALWTALTEADEIAKYHFAFNAAKRDGDAIQHLREDGTTGLTQRILKLDPKSRVEMSFEPGWDDTTTPSTIVFSITEEGEKCMLTCEHFNLQPGQEGVRVGWARYTASLKSYLETGEPLKGMPS